ncbi:MAG TPA: hypothetical protein VES64_09900 [Allosphingosinicella sp.]|nr:hypothetical protein [Allosphingosinicella sp.]
MITRDPTFGPNGGYCYCCCSCFTRDTPIEKSPGSWVMVQDIEAGDTILAAGTDLAWQPTKVKSRSGSTSSAAVTGLYLIFYNMDGEENPRQVLVTPGHLFLTSDSRVLKPVQFLAPGDRLAQADGKSATVVLGVRSGQPVPTSIHTLCMDGSYDGSDLTGRLVNTNGLVSADFEVQVRYEAEHADEGEDALPEIGSPEYIDRHHSDETVDKLAVQMPREFAFETGHGMVRVPNAAKRFLTDAESDHLATVATFSALGNAGPRVAAQRVIALARTVFSDVFFVIDWRETTPNVYAFIDGGQKIVIMNGGFLRIREVYSELALLAAITMAARLDGKECVCEADYYAYAYGLRELVTDTTFVDIVTRALTQITALFGLIGTAGRGGSDPCHDPAMDCRQLTIGNALAFQGVPPCGEPARNLELVRASLSSDRAQIDVVFSAPVEKSSASAVKNYSLLPKARIQSATVDSDNPTRVVLRINAAAQSPRILLIVEHVVSQDNLPLAEGGANIVVQPA